MGLDQALLSQGYTLPGAPRLQANQDGSFSPQDHGLSSILGGLKAVLAQRKMQDMEKEKKMTEEFDAFKTARDAGYSIEKAHEIAKNKKFPDELPGASPAETKAGLEAEKTKAETKKITAEAESAGVKKNTVEAKILNKVAENQDLNPGEQKIYDDILKKKNNGGLAQLLSELNGTTDTGTTESSSPAPDADVRMIAPDGRTGTVKASKVAQFLAKGYKKL